MPPASMNRATLLGVVNNPPEIFEPVAARGQPAKKSLVSFSLLTSESWVDKGTGERVVVSQYHRIVVKNAVLAEIAMKHLWTGDSVMIEGALETRSFKDAAGTSKLTTEVVLGAVGAKLLLLESEEVRQARRTGLSEAALPGGVGV